MSDPLNQPLVLRLEETLRLHAIDASIFAPFVIARLRSHPDETHQEIIVHLQEMNSPEERSINVRLHWEASSAFTLPIAGQERVLTEWAALGVACVLLPALCGVRIVSVAAEGERFDYRVSDGITEWGLEISGTMTEESGELRERLRLKIRQLNDNPYGMMGYVVVVGFVRREALIALPDGGEREEDV